MSLPLTDVLEMFYDTQCILLTLPWHSVHSNSHGSGTVLKIGANS